MQSVVSLGRITNLIQWSQNRNVWLSRSNQHFIISWINCFQLIYPFYGHQWLNRTNPSNIDGPQQHRIGCSQRGWTIAPRYPSRAKLPQTTPQVGLNWKIGMDGWLIVAGPHRFLQVSPMAQQIKLEEALCNISPQDPTHFPWGNCSGFPPLGAFIRQGLGSKARCKTWQSKRTCRTDSSHLGWS